VRTGPFHVVRAADIDVDAGRPAWLVRDLWGASAVGIVGGAPKSFKSWFALDLAVSVASGTPCLGAFEVERTGLVLVFLAEDPTADVKARLAGITADRGLDFDTLDVHVLIEPVLRLDLAEHQDRLRQTVDALGPVLVVLDPLVRLHRLDENSAQQISGLLGFLRELQRAHDCAILLVHHASKKRRGRPGQALRGSSDLHAFGDSNAYLTRLRSGVRLELEHRSAAPPEPIVFDLVEPGPHLALVDGRPREPSLEDRILDALEGADGAITRSALREQLRVNNNRLGDVLRALQQDGRCQRGPDGWQLGPPPTSAVGAGAPPDRPRLPEANQPGGHPWEPDAEAGSLLSLFPTPQRFDSAMPMATVDGPGSGQG